MDDKTEAIHASTEDGSAHLVGIRNLQVVIVERQGYWYAQGIEIDYGVEGCDLEDVRRGFEEGLARTINANLKHFGHIQHLLSRPTPPERLPSLEEGAIRNRYSQISAHLFPFHIEFLEAA